MSYLELQSESTKDNMFHIIVFVILILVLYYKNKEKPLVLKEYNAKPVYLRYTRYDPETGNIKYTD